MNQGRNHTGKRADGRWPKKHILALSLAAIGLSSGLSMSAAYAAEANVLKKIEALEREIESLKAQMRTQDQATSEAPKAARGGPEQFSQPVVGGNASFNMPRR